MRPVVGLRGTAMVTKGGSVEADLAEGLADAEAGVPCTSATAFQVCSVSKQFTAAARGRPDQVHRRPALR